jgi:hypothetical protein
VMLNTLVTPEGSFWIDFTWRAGQTQNRIGSGWITPRHTADHRLAFVEAVLGQMHRHAFSTGPSAGGQPHPTLLVVIPPEEWWMPPLTTLEQEG